MTDNTRTLPNSPEEVYKQLEQRFIWINAKWNIYKQIFATSPERVELLNRSASTFFGICQELFQSDVILALARLNDPRRSRGNDTLSLDQVITLIGPSLSPKALEELNHRAVEVKSLLEPFKVIRDKTLAHNDLDMVFKVDPNLVANIPFDDVERVLSAISRLLNVIHAHFNPDSEFTYTMPILPNDGETIIFVLEQAAKYEESQRRMRS